MFRIATALLGALALAGCNEQSGDPNSKVKPAEYGMAAQPTVLVSGEGNYHWISEFVDGFRLSAVTGNPATVKQLARNGCAVAQPTDEQEFHSVMTYSSGMSSRIFAYNRADLLAEAATYVKSAKNNRRPYQYMIGGRTPKEVLNVNDVMIAKQDKPAYLVLISGVENVVWNIHPAEGAKIDQIVLVGENTQGIANVPEGTNVHSIIGSTPKKCGGRVWFRYTENGRIPRKLNDPTSGWDKDALREGLEKVTKNHRKFALWFRKTFGKNLEKSTIQMDRATHVLFGQMTTGSPKITYQPIAGSVVHLARHDHYHFGDQKEFRAKFEAQVMDLLNKEMGISLDELAKK
ncbi:hypothetical protein ACFQ14_03655 [Pseudahrensia aquimaris]|uniref:Uncharacterized protein n=1 Tax=Pseudahrensia aquimaris TaxID=744461 RepID=A0ABW3FAN5_9HYPH